MSTRARIPVAVEQPVDARAQFPHHRTVVDEVESLVDLEHEEVGCGLRPRHPAAAAERNHGVIEAKRAHQRLDVVLPLANLDELLRNHDDGDRVAEADGDALPEIAKLLSAWST